MDPSPVRSSTPREESSLVFDPFVIDIDHASHSTSTNIIILDEADKVFCPLCLEKVALKGIENVENDLFNQYVLNLFEALDSHGGREQLRQIVLPILEIILKRRPMNVSSEHNFHDLLRIISKIMNSPLFNTNELSSIVRIFSNVVKKYERNDTTPLISIWNTSKQMLDYASSKLGDYQVDPKEISKKETCRFIGSIGIVIETYLEILSRFTIDRVSDIIFPLYQKDAPQTHNRGYYIGSQLECSKYVSDKLIPHCWTFLTDITRPLEVDEMDMVIDIFSTIRECFISSTRTSPEFLDSIIRADPFKFAHNLIALNPVPQFRSKLKDFLKTYTLYYLEKYYGTDEVFKNFTNLDDIVEMNHQNAVVYDSHETKFKKTIFYILLNCVALKQNSQYFKATRVRKVVRVFSNFVLLRESKVILRSYNHVLASVSKRLRLKIGYFAATENFLRSVWREMLASNNNDQFREIFCSDRVVFYWASQYPETRELFNAKSIRDLFQLCLVDEGPERDLNLLLTGGNYERCIIGFLSEEDSALQVIQALANRCLQKSPREVQSLSRADNHIIVAHKLSALLPALLHQAILAAINGHRDLTEEVDRFFSMINSLLRSCQHFELNLDEQFIIDLFKFIEDLYKPDHASQAESTLLLFNEFIILLMKSNNGSLMTVLKYLDFQLLGYMYHRLAVYTRNDLLTENIAHLLLAYDDIDYPTEHNIRKSLCCSHSWMLSQNRDLHLLALILVKKALDSEQNKSSKVCFSSCLLHMLAIDPGLLEARGNLDIVKSIINNDEFKYNPLVYEIMDEVSPSVRRELEIELCIVEHARSPSPAMSFSSSSSSDLEITHATISHIVSQLHIRGDENVRQTQSLTIPESLFASHLATGNRSNNPSTAKDWERRAFNETRMR